MNRITKAQLDLAYSQCIWTGISNAIAMTTLVVFLWNQQPSKQLLTWLAFGYFVSVGRSVIFYFLNKKTTFWSNYKYKKFTLLSAMFLSSCAWAAATIIFIDVNNTESLIILLLGVVGMISIGMPAQVTYFPMFFVFSTPILLTLSGVLWHEKSFGPSTLSIFALLAFLGIGRNLNKSITQSITLNFRNEELLEEVTKAKTQAESANQSKSAFLAAASHDLRQPLHSMGLFLEALKSRLKHQDQEENIILASIIQSHDDLSDLFDSLLEISRLDAGAVKAKIIDFNLKNNLHNICKEFHPSINAKGLFINYDIDDLWVRSDPVLLSRIIRNLLSNAIKFTEKGGINIVLTKSNNHAILSINDTGIGIPETQKKTIFQEYHQLNNQERDRNKGVGLGLAVVQHMAKLLGHKITLTSQVGIGSSFQIELKLVRENINIKNPEKRIPHTLFNSEVNVIVIDDDRVVLEAMALTLKDLGCKATLAHSLEEAQATLTECTVTPNLIITDYRLSKETNGLKAIEVIRLVFHQHIPAIMITGDTDPVLTQKIRKQGYFVLHKPIKKIELQSAINQLLYN